MSPEIEEDKFKTVWFKFGAGMGLGSQPITLI